MLGTALLPSEPRSLLQTLKSETRPHHERAERVVHLMSPDLSVTGYRRYLEAFHGLHATLEPLLATRLQGLSAELRLPERSKLALLREDLFALGHDEASLARLARPPPPSLPGAPEALGALYVMEGSTLGGQLQSRHLRRHFASEAVGDFRYFQSYGEAVGPMWKAFGEALLRACPEPETAPRVVQGAQATFDAFESWLREVPVQ